ncbi:hypothetical protein J6590_027152 [Homalodisca vitripennis]|nr:hypothetical protein J6590_027152 [Homalodisca vitripennis]
MRRDGSRLMRPVNWRYLRHLNWFVARVWGYLCRRFAICDRPEGDTQATPALDTPRRENGTCRFVGVVQY